MRGCEIGGEGENKNLLRLIHIECMCLWYTKEKFLQANGFLSMNLILLLIYSPLLFRRFFFPPRLFFSLCISLALLITFTSHSCARVLRSSKLFGITNTSRDAALLFFPYNVIATSVGSRSDTAARTARRAHSRSSKKLLYFSRLTCAIEEK